MTPEELAAINSPIGHVLLPTAISLVVVTLIALVRWLMSRNAWPYHPAGASGFLKDEIVRIAVTFLPFVLIGIGFRYYFYILHPELANSPYLVFGLLLMVAARFVLRRMPFVKAVAQHIDAARAKAREARLAAKGG